MRRRLKRNAHGALAYGRIVKRVVGQRNGRRRHSAHAAADAVLVQRYAAGALGLVDNRQLKKTQLFDNSSGPAKKISSAEAAGVAQAQGAEIALYRYMLHPQLETLKQSPRFAGQA